MVSDINTALSIIYWTSEQKKLKLNNILHRMYLKNIYIIFYPPTLPPKYALYLAAQGSFSKIDYMLGHKTDLNKYVKS